MRILNEKPFGYIAHYVNLDSGNKGAQENTKTSMLIGTKIITQRVTGLKLRPYRAGSVGYNWAVTGPDRIKCLLVFEGH